MTIAQFIASLLYVASLEIPMPEFWRHTLARHHLMVSLRGIGPRSWRDAQRTLPLARSTRLATSDGNKGEP